MAVDQKSLVPDLESKVCFSYNTRRLIKRGHKTKDQIRKKKMCTCENIQHFITAMAQII